MNFLRNYWSRWHNNIQVPSFRLPSTSSLQRDRFWLIFLLVSCGLLSFYVLRLPAQLESLQVVMIDIIASCAMLTGLWLYRPVPAWRLFAVGQILITIGDLLYTQNIYMHQLQGFEQVREAFFALATGSFIICTWWLVWQKRAWINTDVLIDAMVIAIGLGVFALIFHILPYLNSSLSVTDWIEVIFLPSAILLLLYPITILLMTPLGNRWSIRFVFLALCSYLIGTVFYNQLIVNDISQGFAHDYADLQPLVALSDGFYSACFLLIGAALLHPSIAEPEPLSKERQGLITPFGRSVLGIGVLIVPAAFLIQYFMGQHVDDIILIVSILPVSVLVVWRYNRLVKILEAQNLQLHHQQIDLRHQAHTDSLTGLPNRCFLYQYLREALLRANSQQRTGAVFMLDLNHFKEVNDRLGHTSGDQALIAFAEQFLHLKRSEDLVARWGGDEFVFVLEGIGSAENALAFAHRLHQEIRYPIHTPDFSMDVTVSIGICLFPLEASCDVDTIIKRSDQALYQAKKLLPDQIVLYQ